MPVATQATYQDLHEGFGVGTTTAWDYYQLMVAFLADTLGPAHLSVLVTGRVCLIDGTLVPTVNWRHRKDLRFGKHRRYGVNVQLLVDLQGRLLAASRAFPGSWHDVHCFREAGWVDLVRRSGGGIGDLGYEGELDIMHTPIKKRPNIDLRGVNGTSTAASPGSGAVSRGASGTSRTGGLLLPATGLTCPASTPTFKPPLAYRS